MANPSWLQHRLPKWLSWSETTGDIIRLPPLFQIFYRTLLTKMFQNILLPSGSVIAYILWHLAHLSPPTDTLKQTCHAHSTDDRNYKADYSNYSEENGCIFDDTDVFGFRCSQKHLNFLVG